MTNEFTPHEQALALKKLGFDEPCFGKWLSSLQSNWKDYELILEMGMNEEFEDNRNVYLLGGACSAPTFSQAFRFFREKYNLDSFVKHLYKSTIKVGYYFGIDEYKGVEFQMDFDAWYKTYEEAELACLIKLIEIVKNK
jgi:hypothetical protein